MTELRFLRLYFACHEHKPYISAIQVHKRKAAIDKP